MDVWSAVRWWEEWQLRILVLGSLAVQWFLMVAAPWRRLAIPSWLRTCIWAAYLGGDALAIYALATLFNRHSGAPAANASAGFLEVLWAPVLLIHLGGQPYITAYNVEDNELWRRHVVTLVSQVAVALYAFCRSWPGSGEGDRRLLAAAVLLFVVGLVRTCEKPWALKRASISKVAASSFTSPTANLLLRLFGFICLVPDVERAVLDMEREQIQLLLVDMPLRSAAGGGGHGFSRETTREWIITAFAVLYTRANVLLTPELIAWNLLLPLPYMVAVALFAASNRRAGADVNVTYILLCCTAVMDVLALCISGISLSLVERAGVPMACETAAQCNLISLALRRRRRRPVAAWLINRAGRPCDMENANATMPLEIMRRVAQHLDPTGVVQSRGGSTSTTTIWGSLREHRFDRRVLVWHIATYLCFRRGDVPPKELNGQHDGAALALEACIQVISNYMAYLLNFHPDMLLTGSRQDLFNQAMSEVEPILNGDEQDGAAVADAIIGINMEAQGRTSHGDSILSDAASFARQLRDLPPGEMRETMMEVWVRMLCYSAAMCRGFLHGKALAEGGEFLTMVWLFLSFNRVPMLADKLQILPQLEPVQAQDQQGMTSQHETLDNIV